MNWEATDFDIKWCDEQAYNWMYSQHISPMDYEEEELKKEHDAVMDILMFALARLQTHAN